MGMATMPWAQHVHGMAWHGVAWHGIVADELVGQVGAELLVEVAASAVGGGEGGREEEEGEGRPTRKPG